jgi:hypothetical protein
VTLKSYGPGFLEIFASTSPKIIIKAGNEKASGISLMLTNRFDPPELYEEINSLRPRMGAQMVGAIINALKCQPRAFQIRLFFFESPQVSFSFPRASVSHQCQTWL